MIDHIDHIVLTTRDREACVRFYTKALGMRLEHFGPDRSRLAFRFGNQKINLHEYGHEFEPKAHLPVPGSQDLCFIATVPIEEVVRRLEAAGVTVIEGPVPRTGAVSKLTSVYVRDPDLNLVEISVSVGSDPNLD